VSLAAWVIVVALIVALSTVAVVAEILARALGGLDTQLGWKIRACFTRAVGLYLLVVVCWNGAGTCLVLLYLWIQHPTLSDKMPGAAYYLAAFGSAFVLEFVLANTNVAVFGRGVFAFQQWMELLRGPSITSVRRKHARMTKDLQRRMEDTIAGYTEEELQPYFLKYLGAEGLKRLEEDARQAGASTKQYKVMELVERHPEEARSLADRAKRRK